MGIKIPIPDDPTVPGGITCPYLGVGDMGPMYLSIFGVRNVNPLTKYSPNGLWIVQPQSPCRWYSDYPASSPSDIKQAVVEKSGISTLVSLIFEFSFIPLMYYVIDKNVNTGPNQAVSPWFGGGFSLSLIKPNLAGSADDFSNSMALNTNKKTFLEPVGIDLLKNTYTQRFAQQDTGSCVSVKFKNP